MRKFSAAEVLRFLTAVDAKLSAPVTLLVIGSTVPTLWAFNVLTTSGDIDVSGPVDEAFRIACESVRAELKLPIPVQRVEMFDAPYSYEERCSPLSESLAFRHLRLFVPEKHDWALMKTARGYEHDLALIEEVHRLSPFDEKTLAERYREMQFIGNPDRMKDNFMVLVERLFGPDAATRVEQSLGSPGEDV